MAVQCWTCDQFGFEVCVVVCCLFVCLLCVGIMTKQLFQLMKSLRTLLLSCGAQVLLHLVAVEPFQPGRAAVLIEGVEESKDKKETLEIKEKRQKNVSMHVWSWFFVVIGRLKKKKKTTAVTFWQRIVFALLQAYSNTIKI